LKAKAQGSKSAQNIVEAATTLFRTKGYNMASIDDILKASCTTRGSLYYYFPGGKEELAECVIKNVAQKTSKKLEDCFTPKGEPLRDITDYFLSMADEIDKHCCSISIHLMLIEMAEVNESLRDKAIKTSQHFDYYFYNEIEKCGLDQVKTCQLASMIVSILIGAVNDCMLQGNSSILRSITPTLPLLFVASGYVPGGNKKNAQENGKTKEDHSKA